eukprot:CAMPEP_0118693864 /NCGR_PEP_ID=MMETSP0800-20121206/12165_1 /TAXON_ID=210618 ORGANISM="Striatella unipunctata, Strain CCMP2910" /NCGR_SAMPLE_ID=MMETSP0800 /ASSEMBLY_ACC=CAM_ASM_000638 /LENGTH=90 /DNA_ID=CAMNT_0006592187 /DNA_START=39 /DNA_END=311 /DNA_ORIENTATION=+
MPLVHLKLDSNRVGNAGACALANSLKVNKMSTWINLYYNKIGNPGTLSLLRALEMNVSIDRVDLYENRCDRQLIQDIKSMEENEQRKRMR